MGPLDKTVRWELSYETENKGSQLLEFLFPDEKLTHKDFYLVAYLWDSYSKNRWRIFNKYWNHIWIEEIFDLFMKWNSLNTCLEFSSGEHCNMSRRFGETCPAVATVTMKMKQGMN